MGSALAPQVVRHCPISADNGLAQAQRAEWAAMCPEDAAGSPVIRAARSDEVPLLSGLHRRAAIAGYGHIFPPEAEAPSEAELVVEWERWLGGGHRCFVAAVGDAVVGVVLAARDTESRHRGAISRLYVEPERWGEGIGRQLYEAAVRYLRDEGVITATLWVLEGNHRARSWYERLGWRPNGTRKMTYAPARIEDLGYELALDKTPQF